MKDTFFAPAEVYGDAELQTQQKLIRTVPMLEVLLNSVPVSVLVLNNLRQIVYYNKTFYDFIELHGNREIIGKRPGQVFNCIHANELPNGCGTTEFCQTCGAVKAILASQKGDSTLEECRILVERDLEVLAMDLRVWSTPFTYEGIQFNLLSIADISDEKRRNTLEHIFFHDILNNATTVLGYVSILNSDTNHMYSNLIELKESVELMVDDIEAQRDLKYAEQGELSTKISNYNCKHIIDCLIERMRYHSSSKDRVLLVDSRTADVEIETDRSLLSRVLINMIKNALEACPKDKIVTAGCHKYKDHVEFWVANPMFIPRIHQLQLYNRSFSTKGNGRGLGTYSMRLLTESYLNGRLSFVSTPHHGTTFSVYLPLDYAADCSSWKDDIDRYPVNGS